MKSTRDGRGPRDELTDTPATVVEVIIPGIVGLFPQLRRGKRESNGKQKENKDIRNSRSVRAEGIVRAHYKNKWNKGTQGNRARGEQQPPRAPDFRCD